MTDVELIEVAHGRSRQAPPPHVVKEVLSDPLGSQRWRWLILQDDERIPDISTAAQGEIWWSSLWPAWPSVRVQFQVEPDGQGSAVQWSILAPPQSLDADETGAC